MITQINLLHSNFRKKHLALPFSRMLLIITLASLTIPALIISNNMELKKIYAQKNKLSAEYANLRLQRKKLQDALLQTNKNPELAAEEARLEIIMSHWTELVKINRNNQFSDGHGYSDYLIALAQQHIANIWLTKINIQKNGAQISLEGKTHDAITLPEYLDRLAMEPVLAGKNFETLRMKRDLNEQKNNAPIIFIAATALD